MSFFSPAWRHAPQARPPFVCSPVSSSQGATSSVNLSDSGSRQIPPGAIKPRSKRSSNAEESAISTGRNGPPVRLQVFSDLHLGADSGFVPPLASDVDIVVVAGDVCEIPWLGFSRLRDVIPMHVPIVMVAGNHEFYHGHIARRLELAWKYTPEFKIHFLEDAAVVVNGVRFIGATLWTDYGLDGCDRRDQAMMLAERFISDHYVIRTGALAERPFRPEDALTRHEASRLFIASQMLLPHEGPTVVVTHHAPHPGSLHPCYASSRLNASFINDLTELIEDGIPDLWIHGHVHTSWDYRVAKTRVLCNPRGYGTENPEFDPALVVEVTR